MNSSPTQPLTTATDPLSAIVVKHTDLVFSVAKRRLGNDSLAEEVTQTVFIRLAQSGARFSSDGQLMSWLHRTATNAAVDLWRSESRRKAREREAMMNMERAQDELPGVMESLDAAIEQLGKTDREMILLRFFSHRPMREIAQAFGISEDATKMRISRAVHKLRERFVRAGVSCSVAALTTLLTTQTIEAAPAGITARVCDSINTLPASARVPGATPILRWAAVGFIAVTCWVLLVPHGDRSGAPEKPNESAASLQRAHRSQLPSPSRLPPREKSTATIVTKVVRADTKEPVVGALVVWETISDRASSSTEPDGVATLEILPNTADKHLQFGGYVFANGFLPVSALKGIDVDVTNASLRMFTAEIETGPSISGTVVDESGMPVPDVHIFVDCPAVEHLVYSRDEASVHSDASGQWVFSAIPKWWSDVSFLLLKDGFAPTVATVSMTDEPRVATVIIEHGKEVVGRIMGTDGEAVANAEVTLSWGINYNPYLEPKRVISGPDGAFAFRQVNPLSFMKTLVLEARADGFAMRRTNVVCTNATNLVEINLRPSGTLRGRVLDREGQPVIANIRAGSEQGGITSDADGRFVWNDAPIEAEFEVQPIFSAESFAALRSPKRALNQFKRVRLRADGSEHEIRLEPQHE